MDTKEGFLYSAPHQRIRWAVIRLHSVHQITGQTQETLFSMHSVSHFISGRHYIHSTPDSLSLDRQTGAPARTK